MTDIAHTELVINREVQIKRKSHEDGESGSRVDLWVHALNPSNDETLTLCIEVKGSWNDSSKDAIENQLLKKYLSGGTATSGILLLGWYYCKNWNLQDPKKAASNRNWPNREDAIEELNHQSRCFSTPSIPICSRVIDCSLK